MKALLIKDFYVLRAQMKSLLLMIVIFSIVPNEFLNHFAVLYAAMLPFSSVAWDDRSRWNQLAAMMPYTTREIVLSKYVFGWICLLGCTVLSLAATMLRTLIPMMHAEFHASSIWFSFNAVLIVIALTLPLLFRFGTEKARLILSICMAIVFASTVPVTIMTTVGGERLSPVLLIAMPAVGIVLNVISARLSERFYKMREQ